MTALPKGEERPYLRMTARITFRGGSAEWLGLVPCHVPDVLRYYLCKPIGGAFPWKPHKPRALQALGVWGYAPGGLGLQCLVISGSHSPTRFAIVLSFPGFFLNFYLLSFFQQLPFCRSAFCYHSFKQMDFIRS